MKGLTIFFLIVIGVLLYFTAFKPLALISPSSNQFFMVGGNLACNGDPLCSLRPAPVASPTAQIGPYTITTRLMSDQTIVSGTDQCLPLFPQDNQWAYNNKNVVPPPTMTSLSPETFVNSAGIASSCAKTQITVASNACIYSGGRCYNSPWNGMNQVFGGRVTTSTYSTGCFDNTTITNNGVVVYQDSVYASGARVFTDGNITVLLHQGSYALPFNGNCAHVDNSITYKVPSSAVNVTIAPISSAVTSGITSTTITIDNEWTYDLDADVTMTFSIPTGLSLPSTQTMNQSVRLPHGVKSVFTYSIPAVATTSSMTVTPSMKFYVNPAVFSNVNLQQDVYDHNVPSSLYSRILVGSFDGTPQTVAVSGALPQPTVTQSSGFLDQLFALINSLLQKIGVSR